MSCRIVFLLIALRRAARSWF